MSLIRYVTQVRTVDAGDEDPSLTRDRLRDRFPPRATRRMTQLGLLIGDVLLDMNPGPQDAIVYASRYAETRALEAFVDSFPGASPTLFQTSIHPSAVQQVMIGRQQPVAEFLPITGDEALVGQALTAAFVSPSPRVIVCGGEERGTWLLEKNAASDRSFAFAFDLSLAEAGACAKVDLAPGDAASVSHIALTDLLAHLGGRKNFLFDAPGGGRVTWTWA